MCLSAVSEGVCVCVQYVRVCVCAVCDGVCVFECSV